VGGWFFCLLSSNIIRADFFSSRGDLFSPGELVSLLQNPHKMPFHYRQHCRGCFLRIPEVLVVISGGIFSMPGVMLSQTCPCSSAQVSGGVPPSPQLSFPWGMLRLGGIACTGAPVPVPVQVDRVVDDYTAVVKGLVTKDGGGAVAGSSSLPGGGGGRDPGPQEPRAWGPSQHLGEPCGVWPVGPQR